MNKRMLIGLLAGVSALGVTGLSSQAEAATTATLCKEKCTTVTICLELRVVSICYSEERCEPCNPNESEDL